MTDHEHKQKYFDHLNALHEEERLDILRAVTILKEQFPELSSKEAARLLMQWVMTLEDTDNTVDW